MSNRSPEHYSSEDKQTKDVKHRRSPAEIFVLVVSLSFAVYLIFYAIYGDASFVDVFFIRCKDLFMDFFNSVRDASQGAAVYTERHVIYPPMANLIYLICSRFIPVTYNQSDWYNRLSWTNYTEAVFFIVIFTLALILICYTLIHEKLSGGRRIKFLFAFFAIFNIPMLYMIERGNMILFCLISLMIYAFTYNSQNKLYREVGLISLAFAFSLKLYPAIFGWMLIADKRYKEAFRCAAYGILMMIIPSFFFGGPACFLQIFYNITSFSSGVELVNSISVLAGYSHIPVAVWNIGAYIWCAVGFTCFLLSPFIHKERWKVWVLGISFILTVPALTAIYVWAFFLIPIVFMSNSGKLKMKDWYIFAVILSLFVFTLFRFNHYLTINSLLMYPVTVILSITAVTDTVVSGVRKYKKSKRSQEYI